MPRGSAGKLQLMKQARRRRFSGMCGNNLPMDLPIMPPYAPMLAKAVSEIPLGAYQYEPKWDGFRAIVFHDADEVEIGSRSSRTLTRYFPELLPAVRTSTPRRCILDGEIVLPDPDSGQLDFEALQQRIHPAESRVRMLSQRTPAVFVAFDLLALEDRDMTRRPLEERRRVLESVLADAPSPIFVTPATADRNTARRWFNELEGAGIDGIVAKRIEGTYESNKRVMFKIKHVRTADCVVAGYRTYRNNAQAIGSLLLGLYDEFGELASVGVVGAFPDRQRRSLFAELQPLVTTLEGHPWDWVAEGTATRTPRSAEYSRWSVGKDLSFVPLRPERVVEVRYDHMQGNRFRHTAQFVRWRPDREPRSCTFDQREVPTPLDIADILDRHTPFRSA